MRLIDADALKKEVKTLFCPDGYKILMLERIDSAPAIIKCSMTSDGLPLMDLRPRPEGKWKDHSKDGYVECPFCEHLTNCEDNIDELHYCWNCGAMMQKDGAE